MSRRNTLDLVNIVVAKVIPAERLGYPHTEEDLSELLRKFNHEDVLINLCRINLFLQRSKNFLRDERILKENFCHGIMLNGIDACIDIREDFVFSRQGTLRLLDKCACISEPQSDYTIDNTKAMNDLAKAYLMVNGLLNTSSSALSTSEAVEERNLLVNSIPFQEYATNEAPEMYIKHLVVRTSEFLRLLQKDTSRLEVSNIFFQKIGLTLQDYQYLIFLIFTFYWTFTSEDILRQDPLTLTSKSLFFNPNGQSDELTPLYQKLLPHICVSIETLGKKAKNYQQYTDEFLLWREYPLLKISENRTICVDFFFLLDKLQTGAYWLIRRKCLKDSKERGSFEDLWGDVFEDYATSIIERGIHPQCSSNREILIIKPLYDQKQQAECVDVAVCCDDTLILLECKSTLLSANSKFSGDFNKFYDGATSVKKGIKQLGKAVSGLGNKDVSKRQFVKDIDICKITRVYPVLILSDRILSYLFMNQVLDSKFQYEVQQTNLMTHLDIMPLTALTIMDLELLEPYMQDKPFYERLGEWLDWSENRQRSGFTAYIHDLIDREQRNNHFMDQGFARITSEGQKYFSSKGIS